LNSNVLINFVALLGWNPGDEQEFFTMEELISKFTLERVHKAGAVFNIEKLNWLNAEHLRSKSNEEILLMLKDELAKSYYKDKIFDDDYLLLIIEAMKPRVSFVNEYITNCTYFYVEPTEFDENVIKKRWKEDTPEQLTKLRDNIAQLDNPVKEDFENALTKTAEELKVTRQERAKANTEAREAKARAKVLNAVTGLMSEVYKKKNGSWNVSQIAEDTQLDRRTVSKYIKELSL